MVYVAALESEVELALVPSESQPINCVLLLTAQADETNEKGSAPKRSKEIAKLQRARETW